MDIQFILKWSYFLFQEEPLFLREFSAILPKDLKVAYENCLFSCHCSQIKYNTECFTKTFLFVCVNKYMHIKCIIIGLFLQHVQPLPSLYSDGVICMCTSPHYWAANIVKRFLDKTGLLQGALCGTRI